jgi:hypothetical protein
MKFLPLRHEFRFQVGFGRLIYYIKLYNINKYTVDMPLGELT